MAKKKAPKLLTEPRPIKDIVINKPKKFIKKKKKSDSEPKMEYVVIYESNKDKVNGLYEIYEKDPYKARVKYMNDNNGYNFMRTVLFKRNETD